MATKDKQRYISEKEAIERKMQSEEWSGLKINIKVWPFACMSKRLRYHQGFSFSSTLLVERPMCTYLEVSFFFFRRWQLPTLPLWFFFSDFKWPPPPVVVVWTTPSSSSSLFLLSSRCKGFDGNRDGRPANVTFFRIARARLTHKEVATRAQGHTAEVLEANLTQIFVSLSLQLISRPLFLWPPHTTNMPKKGCVWIQRP